MTALLAMLAVLILFTLVMLWLFCFAFVRRNDSDIDNLDAKHNQFLTEYKDIIKSGMNYIDNTPYSWVFTKSFDGLKLAARYFPIKDSHRTIILFHGYRSSAKRDFSCAVKMYCSMGLNVLLIDQRSHGKSEGRIITFGVKERYDALTWVDFVLKNYGNDTDIFLAGMSMGATTVLLSAGLNLPKNVKGIIADCGFTSPIAIIKKVSRQAFHISGFIVLPIMDFFCRIFGRFSIKGISTTDALAKSKTPIIMFHGTKDNFVPMEMSRENFDAAGCEKQLFLVENADHGFSYFFDTRGVTEKVYEFIYSH